MPTCLVTGGAGFIGSHLVETLVRQGHLVRVLDDLSTGKLSNLSSVRHQVDFQQGSVTDLESVRLAVRDVDRVFHLAALPSVQKSVEDPVRTHEVCATGTLNVLLAAKEGGVRRVIYAASSSAYGDQVGALRREDDPLLPLSPYAAAKLAGEHYCQAFTRTYGLETVRLRLFNVFGPRQDASNPYSGVIALFLRAFLEDRTPTIYGDGLQSRDFVFVEDVVQAFLLAAESPKAFGNVYNVGSGQATSLLDLTASLNRIFGTEFTPIHAPPRPGDVRHSQADIGRAEHDLGYRPRFNLEEGLRATLNWLRADAFRASQGRGQ
ncbi:MAG: SDR family oxidoreductase [Gemmatales bacterium]|nr:SDR family oxidoreductase [Gemmatales bacterium]MDW8386996.1 SDR family oxidoreductase [Gemmatales bacterium]